MVGKAVVYQTKVDKIIQMDKNQKELYALNRQRISIQQTQISPGGATPSSSGSSGGSGNFLETQGDTMIGPIAFAQALVIIDVDGRIDISETSQVGNQPLDYRTYVAVTGASDPDDLYWIDGAAYNGQLLYLQGTVSQLINLNNAIEPQISSISGTGTVSVITSVNHGLATGRIVNIVGTTNFNVGSVSVTVTGATTFTYSDAGDVTPESTGTVQDGNIFTNDATTVALEGNTGTRTRPVCTLLFDPIDNGWRVVARPDSVSGGIAFPITPPVDSRGNVNTAQDIDLSLSTAHSTKMTLTGDIAITFSNIPAALTQIEWEIEIKQDGIGGHSITSWPAGVVSIPTIDPDADAVTLVALRTNDNGTVIDTLFASAGSVSNVSLWANFVAITNINAGDNDILAVDNIDFDGASSTIQGLHNLDFAQANQSINSLAGELDYQVAATQFHRFIAGGAEIARFEDVAGVLALDMQDNAVEGVKDISFDATATFVGAGAIPTIGYDLATTEFRYNAPTAATHRFTINNVFVAEITSASFLFADNFTIVGNPGATSAGINVGQLTGDPSTTFNGDLWYNATSNKLRTKVNGVNVDVGSGGQTPILQDIDYDGFDIKDISNVEFRNTTGVPAVATPAIWVTATDMNFSVPTGDSFLWRFNGGSAQMTLNSVTLALVGVSLDLDNNDIQDVDQIQITGTTGDVVHGFISGQTGLFDISANANSSSVRIFARSSGGSLNQTVGISDLEMTMVNHPIADIFDLQFNVPSGVVPVISGSINSNEIVSTVGSGFGFEWRINSVNEMRLEIASLDLQDKNLVGVNQIDLTTPAGAAVASIIANDAVPDVLEIKLGAATDFTITDNGTVRASFDNTLLKWQFGGSSVLALPQETQISDRASAPSTPPSGFMNLYVINVAGVQTFKVKFDNGTEKTIATDV